MARLLVLALFVFVAVKLARALLRRSGERGTIEPTFWRTEELVEIPLSSEPESLDNARRKLDAAGIATNVRDGAILVPRTRVEAARAIVAKRVG